MLTNVWNFSEDVAFAFANCKKLLQILRNSFHGCLRQSWLSRQTTAQLRRRFYGGWQVVADSQEGNVGVFQKLSKWFHGPADLVEPSGPEQMESYNIWSWEIKDKLFNLFTRNIMSHIHQILQGMWCHTYIKYFMSYPAGARSAPAGPKGPKGPGWAFRRASAQAVTLKWQLPATSPMNTSSSAGENGFSAKNGS